MDRGLRRNLPLFFVFRGLLYAHLWIPIWVVFLTVERGFTLAQVTTADGLFFLAVSVLEVPTGAVADRWGRSRSMALGGVCLAAALLVFAYTHSFPVLLASFMLWALAETLFSGADLALLFDTLRAQGREHEYERLAGRAEATAWGGAAVATLFGGWVAAATSLRFTVLTGIGVCLSLTLVALLLREPPRGRSEHEPQPGYLATLTGGVRIAWRDRAVRWLVLLNGLLAATLGATNYLIQPLLVSRGVEVGFLFSTLQLPWLVFAAVGAFIAGALVRRAGEVVVLGGVVVVGAAAYALLASTSTPASFALFGVVAAMEALLVPVVTGYVNRRTPSAQRATVLSTQSLVRGLCFAPLGPLVGTAADTRGIEWALGMLGTLLVAGAAVVWPLWLRAHRRAARERMAEALAAGARLRGGGLDEVEAAPE